MSDVTPIPTVRSFHGRVPVPGDKSLGHRALMFAALAEGVSTVAGLPSGADVRSTRSVLTSLGVQFENLTDGAVRVIGCGGNFATPATPLDCGNSGTTMRLMTGILAGAGIDTTLVGDASLTARPMARVAKPLAAFGAEVTTTDGKPPLKAHSHGGKTLKAPAEPISTGVASAQVKSALLLAGLFAEGTTTVVEPAASRDHTERYMRWLGVPIRADGLSISIDGPARPKAFTQTVACDPSSAAFVAAVAVLCDDADVTIPRVLYNPSRLGFFRALSAMGADVQFSDPAPDGPEEVADIRVRSGRLTGTRIDGELSLDSLDELPLLALMGAFAEGETIVADAAELRHKESDRIASTAAMVRALGGTIEEREDGWRIVGGPLRGGEIDAGHDHRIALSGAVAGSRLPGVTVRNFAVAEVSFPGFLDVLRRFGSE
ncbi:MAG: 3-phosphoshikimate 1-carboxyvinyltransferase [Deltaproteobacteria bacterium]|nr:3-phosphoshikimate 1-carboxyvinyltransferase [Deltaproteobacteria bacterium]